MAPGLTGAPGGSVTQARTVCTPGPGHVTTPPLSWGGWSARGRRSTKVTRTCQEKLMSQARILGGDKAIFALGGAYSSTADFLHADGTSWCFKDKAYMSSGDKTFHTLSGMTSCGGSGQLQSTSCFIFRNNAWSPPITLRKSRREHTSWQTSAGVVLMGGSNSRGTTEIVNNGVSNDYFDLEYPTRWLLNSSLIGPKYFALLSLPLNEGCLKKQALSTDCTVKFL